MKFKNAWIYLNTKQCFGSHEGGWSRQTACRGELPAAQDLAEIVDERAFQEKKLGLLLMDDLLHPLRLKLDQPAKGQELTSFLLFRLKRYLSYSVDAAEIRYFPLADDLSYLTMSLPKPWLDGVYGFFQEKGVQLGYVGGLLTTLLTETSLGWGRLTIGLYRDVYVLAEMDEAGRLVQFRTRRLPLKADETLDIQTLVHSDWEGFMQETPPTRTVQLLTLTDDHDGDLATMRMEMDRFRAGTEIPSLAGNALQRFQTLLMQPTARRRGA